MVLKLRGALTSTLKTIALEAVNYITSWEHHLTWAKTSIQNFRVCMCTHDTVQQVYSSNTVNIMSASCLKTLPSHFVSIALKHLSVRDSNSLTYTFLITCEPHFPHSHCVAKCYYIIILLLIFSRLYCKAYL